VIIWNGRNAFVVAAGCEDSVPLAGAPSAGETPRQRANIATRKPPGVESRKFRHLGLQNRWWFVFRLLRIECSKDFTIDRIQRRKVGPGQIAVCTTAGLAGRRYLFSLTLTQRAGWRKKHLCISEACCRHLADRMRRCVTERSAGKMPAAR